MLFTIKKTAAIALGSATLVAAFAGPAAADDNYPHIKACQPGAAYAVGWDNSAHQVFGRDCKSDGWGILVEAWSDANGLPDNPLGYVWDRSSAGNGAWRPANGCNPDQPVIVLVYKTKDDLATSGYVTTIGPRDYKC